MPEPIINPAALEPLFGPSDVPNLHRVRAASSGAPAEVKNGRRPSPIGIVQELRRAVSEWREAQYGGASDTSRELLHHWFSQSHHLTAPDGSSFPFSYYFCQQEAVETLVYLYEVRGIATLSGLVGEFGGPDSERAALGISPDEDLWPRYALKIATGAGKTKVMSLAIVWSYFHALRESDSPLTRHFLILAPGVTVFERLKEDFGHGRIFGSDPLIPTAWRGDWNMSVVLQDEAGGATTGGTIYLTNIHRLYETRSRRKKDTEPYDWMGPAVSKSQALDTAAALRERVTEHPRVMVLNDEAHHVWDPGSAWSEAIKFLHESTRQRGGGLVAQLDLSATPKDDKGNVFRHVVCDTPLGEAVDAGIVKTPIIGSGGQLVERAHEDAGYRYETHLTLGYKRWIASNEEWEKAGKKPLMFVMTENTEAADQITRRLSTDPVFKELNGKTVNLHTNLKGKLKKRGKGASAYYEFIESEKDISDDDLEALRKLSRELDSSTSPYSCIVSVLMLREGWDVRNVTTIVPLRPLTAASKILPEQTLGRGLRRMTPPGLGGAAEVVTVVEHKAFLDLYKEQLSQEGLPIEVVDVDKVPRTTVTIYPDAENKDLDALELQIPQLSRGYRIEPKLENLLFEEVHAAFKKFSPLPLGNVEEREINYQGRHLITDEIVEQMRVKLSLLADPIGGISFFREELERATRIRGTHAQLAPLIQRFLEELLFGERVDLYDPRLLGRLADTDVREHMRATFVPLILEHVTHKEQRTKEAPSQSVCNWKPYQVTHSERHPVELADTSPFNLVPCNRELEVALSHFLDRADDVASFAKNAGPQALRVDYLTREGRRSLYTPDFLVRQLNGDHLVIESKGRADRDVARKAAAAVEWCKAASKQKTKWSYVYVPQDVFERHSGTSVGELARSCSPALSELLAETKAPDQTAFQFGGDDEARIAKHVAEFIDSKTLEQLPSRYRQGIEHAVTLYHFHVTKTGVSFAPIFQPLLGPIDEAAKAIVVERLSPDVPVVEADQKVFFEPELPGKNKTKQSFLHERARSLKRLLVHNSPIMPTGVLKFCLEYAAKDSEPAGGVFTSVRAHFAELAATDVPDLLGQMYNFRNEYIAHGETELKDPALTEEALRQWIQTLQRLYESGRAEAGATR